MRPQSAKAKGRRLQQETRDAILATFPELEPDDVRSTSMGASGADILLSPAARRRFPFYVECKNVESLNIHKALAQATKPNAASPLVVFRKNNSPTYAALPFPVLLDLLKRAGDDDAATIYAAAKEMPDRLPSQRVVAHLSFGSFELLPFPNNGSR